MVTGGLKVPRMERGWKSQSYIGVPFSASFRISLLPKDSNYLLAHTPFSFLQNPDMSIWNTGLQNSILPCKSNVKVYTFCKCDLILGKKPPLAEFWNQVAKNRPLFVWKNDFLWSWFGFGSCLSNSTPLLPTFVWFSIQWVQVSMASVTTPPPCLSIDKGPIRYT